MGALYVKDKINMDALSKLFLVLLFTSPFAINATEHEIKVGDSFMELRAKYGMPETVTFLSNSDGLKFETIHFKSHQTAYIFNASVGSSMDLQSNPSFKICRVIKNPEPKTSYMCEFS